MRQWIVQAYGGPEGLAVVEREQPVPAASEVLVQVRAVSLNYRDLLNAQAYRPGSLPRAVRALFRWGW